MGLFNLNDINSVAILYAVVVIILVLYRDNYSASADKSLPFKVPRGPYELIYRMYPRNDMNDSALRQSMLNSLRRRQLTARVIAECRKQQCDDCNPFGKCGFCHQTFHCPDCNDGIGLVSK